MVTRASNVVPSLGGDPVPLRELPEEELMARALSACQEERRLVAEVVVYLIEVDRRRLDLRAACSSLFDYCTRHLHMSGGAAHRRINAVRLVKRYPFLLSKLASGELHLCGLLILRDHFTDANAEELAAAASGLSEAKLHELVAARAPRPPVPERLGPVAEQAGLPAPMQPPARQSRTAPLSSTTYALQLTMTAETHAKLRRAQDLMRHRQPDGNLAVVLDRALDALLVQLERQLLAKTQRPRASKGRTKGISRATRREVFERDGQQCTYRSETGERCPALAFLELDHEDAQARGGSHDAANLRVLCHAHNHLHAEDDFGVEHVAACIEERRAVDAAASVDESRLPEHAPPTVGERPEGGSSEEGAQVEREKMAVYGLTDMGFTRADCVEVVRAVLGRSAPDRPMVDVLRETIGELASRPRPRPGRGARRSAPARAPSWDG